MRLRRAVLLFALLCVDVRPVLASGAAKKAVSSAASADRTVSYAQLLPDVSSADYYKNVLQPLRDCVPCAGPPAAAGNGDSAAVARAAAGGAVGSVYVLAAAASDGSGSLAAADVRVTAVVTLPIASGAAALRTALGCPPAAAVCDATPAKQAAAAAFPELRALLADLEADAAATAGRVSLGELLTPATATPPQPQPLRVLLTPSAVALVVADVPLPLLMRAGGVCGSEADASWAAVLPAEVCRVSVAHRARTGPAVAFVPLVSSLEGGVAARPHLRLESGAAAASVAAPQAGFTIVAAESATAAAVAEEMAYTHLPLFLAAAVAALTLCLTGAVFPCPSSSAVSAAAAAGKKKDDGCGGGVGPVADEELATLFSYDAVADGAASGLPLPLRYGAGVLLPVAVNLAVLLTAVAVSLAGRAGGGGGGTHGRTPFSAAFVLLQTVFLAANCASTLAAGAAELAGSPPRRRTCHRRVRRACVWVWGVLCGVWVVCAFPGTPRMVGVLRVLPLLAFVCGGLFAPVARALARVKSAAAKTTAAAATSAASDAAPTSTLSHPLLHTSDPHVSILVAPPLASASAAAAPVSTVSARAATRRRSRSPSLPRGLDDGVVIDATEGELDVDAFMQMSPSSSLYSQNPAE